MKTQWDNFGPRVGLAWDPTGDGRTSVRASLRPIVRVRQRAVPPQHVGRAAVGLRSPSQRPAGGLDNPFLGSPGGQTNIFPVTFDQNAPFSLNGPFLSLSNDMVATHVDSWNVTLERQLSPRGSRRPATSAAAPTTSGNRRRSTTPCSSERRHGAAPSAANINARRPFTLADPEQRPVLRAGGSVRHRRQAALQRHAAVGSARRRSLDADGELHAVALLRLARRLRRRARRTSSSATTSPSDPGYDDGNCTAIGCTTSR